MSSIKTVTGYAVTLVVVLALLVAACGIDTETPAAPQPQPPVEDVTVSDDAGDADGIDEYDTVQLIKQYEASVATMPVILETMMSAEDCVLYNTDSFWHERFWFGFLDQDTGFWSTAPDELRYLRTDAQVRADVEPMVDAHCSGVS